MKRTVLFCFCLFLSHLCFSQVSGGFRLFEDGNIYFVLKSECDEVLHVSLSVTHNKMAIRDSKTLPPRHDAFWGQESFGWQWMDGDVVTVYCNGSLANTWRYSSGGEGFTAAPGNTRSRNASPQGDAVRLYDKDGNYVDKGMLWIVNGGSFVQYRNVRYNVTPSPSSSYKYKTEIQYAEDYLYIK